MQIRLAPLWLLALLVVGCTDEASVRKSISAAEPTFQPVIDALEKYEQERGSYPERLDVLVGNGYLEEVPSVPEVPDASAEGPYYKRFDETSCEFSFGYHLYDQGFGLGDTTYSSWQPDGRGWRRTGPGY